MIRLKKEKTRNSWEAYRRVALEYITKKRNKLKYGVLTPDDTRNLAMLEIVEKVLRLSVDKKFSTCPFCSSKNIAEGLIGEVYMVTHMKHKRKPPSETTTKLDIPYVIRKCNDCGYTTFEDYYD